MSNTLHILITKEELQIELLRRSSYLSLSSISTDKITDPQLLILGDDESLILTDLIREAYAHVFGKLQPYIADQESCPIENDNLHFDFSNPETLKPSQQEAIGLNIRQGILFWIMARWLSDKHTVLSGYHLSLADSAIKEARRLLDRRRTRIRRRWSWWG